MKKELEKLAEIRNQEGKTIFSVWLNPYQAMEFRDRIENRGDPGDSKNEKDGDGPVSGSNNGPMTDAQKRYLFRLLADRKIEGEAAYKHLKEEFGVDSLSKITKYDASKAIDRMLSE